MAKKSEKKVKKRIKKQPSGNGLLRRIGYITGVYLALALLLLITSVLLVLMFWIMSLPNWTLFFTYLHADILLEYVKVLIWPFFITIVLIIFHKELKNLINRIKRFKWGDKIAELDSAPQPVAPVESTLINTNDSNLQQQPSETDTNYRERVYNDPLVQLAFERVYRNIYGTQISLLNFLASNGGPVASQALDIFYQKHLELLSGGRNYFNSIHDYMAYLTSNGLVDHNTEKDTYSLQGFVGQLFLRYLGEQGIGDPNMKLL